MIIIKPIGYVRNSIPTPVDDNWGDIQSIIRLIDELPEASLQGLEEFSHCEIIFYFHKVQNEKICITARHPRNNKNFPEVGIFSQRAKDRPNKIGSTICEIIKIKGKEIFVKGLDAVDSTPVIDIKPVIKEFLPQNIEEPDWVIELMKDYWKVIRKD